MLPAMLVDDCVLDEGKLLRMNLTHTYRLQGFVSCLLFWIPLLVLVLLPCCALAASYLEHCFISVDS